MNKPKELEWTGERLVTSIKAIGAVEHLHRYAIACEFIKDKIVLDIASGEGYGSNLLAKNAKQVIGVDISEEAIKHASVKYLKNNLTFKVGSVTDIPLPDKSIDICVSFETLEHIYEQEEMIKEIHRVLKTDGILIISTPERSNYGDIGVNNHFHVKELYFNEFQSLLKKTFKNIVCYQQKIAYGSIMVPIKEISNSFVDYKGSFKEITSVIDQIDRPIFNICIASNHELPNPKISFFDGMNCHDNQINELQNQIKLITNSRTYKFGKFILTPLSYIKKFIQ